MKHAIIGTAGHVDHGKTTLIRALTGMDTDRLKEEQERGMTIDLGFAALMLPDGTVAGIVDVPGHERFLKNMLAGAGGVDVVLLVVAADESVMPQTVEHLDILRLLDVKNGVVALTKCDMVEEEWVSVVEDDIRSRLKGTFLAEAPIVRVDSLRGTGIPELKKHLLASVSRTEPRNVSAPFRLPVDRVFTRPGFGTVVTGTLVSGTLRVGDTVEVLPQRIQTRIRGLHSHNRKQDAVEAGSRTAANLVGVEVEALERGALLVPPGFLAPTQICDAAIRVLETAAKPLRDRARVRFYLGTAEILGRLRVLGQDEIGPGKSGYVQFRAEKEFACARGDRFVLRTYSPMRTVAGGTVLDPAPQPKKRNDRKVLETLQARERGTPEDLLEAWLSSAPFGKPRKEAARSVGLAEADSERAVEDLLASGRATALEGDRLIGAGAWSALRNRLLSILNAYHEANPIRPGMPREELRGMLGTACDSKAFLSAVAALQKAGAVAVEGATVRLADFKVRLNDKQEALLGRISSLFETAAFAAPTLQETADELRVPLDAVISMVRLGQDQGVLVKIAEGLYYHAKTVEKARAQIRDWIRKEGKITVSQFRDLTGSSRKYAVPVMEYFDAIRFTRRVGDERTLAETETKEH